MLPHPYRKPLFILVPRDAKISQTSSDNAQGTGYTSAEIKEICEKYTFI